MSHLLLGIETSCDETAAAVVREGKEVLSNIVSSQVELHRPFGGVVPEIACRAHIDNIPHVVREALDRAQVTLEDLSAVAVTAGPGLVGALLVGIGFAKGLMLGGNLPLVAVDHIEAHIYSSAMEHETLEYPFLSLVVSGGHTSLFYTTSPREVQLVGSTIDDAAGEAFDKVASLLELEYPGGPSIEKTAREGNPRAVRFPRSFLRDKDRLEFSFSGLKTSVLYHTRGQDRSRGAALDPSINVPDVAASFQAAVVDVLVEKTFQGAEKYGVNQIALGGGVACNTPLREKMKKRGEKEGISVYFPSRQYCTDNAAMIAGLGYHHYMAGDFAPSDLEAHTRSNFHGS